jgi:hypothetical protein
MNGSPPHDVREEKQLDNVFEQPEVQKALSDTKSLMRKMADTMSQSQISLDESSTLHRLEREAARLAAYRSPASRTVGFVGDSGVGRFCYPS